jgi:hypothetical protein
MEHARVGLPSEYSSVSPETPIGVVVCNLVLRDVNVKVDVKSKRRAHAFHVVVCRH